MMRRIHRLLFTAGLLAGGISLAGPVQAQDGQGNAAPQQEQQPAQQETAPSQQETAPSQQETAPSQQETAPSQQETTPSQQEAVPTQPGIAPPQSQAATPPSYDLDKIVIDDKEHQIGDTVPAKYLTKQYEIVEWQKRHLPAPQDNSHWTYASGNYLMITNDTGKILKAESGDIFFSNN